MRIKHSIKKALMETNQIWMFRGAQRTTMYRLHTLGISMLAQTLILDGTRARNFDHSGGNP